MYELVWLKSERHKSYGQSNFPPNKTKKLSRVKSVTFTDKNRTKNKDFASTSLVATLHSCGSSLLQNQDPQIPSPVHGFKSIVLVFNFFSDGIFVAISIFKKKSKESKKCSLFTSKRNIKKIYNQCFKDQWLQEPQSSKTRTVKKKSE
jgi:hypothetical protein